MLSISESEFDSIYKMMFSLTGVRLKETKKPLIVSRLRKRIEDLKLKDFTEYMKLVVPSNKAEIEYFVNALTTNETFFFRHTRQFSYLYDVILPSLLKSGQKKIEIWSGASSTGEEPYSIVMTLMEFSRKQHIDFKVHASDINSDVIVEAKQGVYDERALKEVPDALKKRYFKVTQHPRYGTQYAVSDEVKSKVCFFQHNLQQVSTIKGMDIIFLRNVLIYFERDIKERVVNLLEPSLKQGGHFIISLAENLNDIKTDLKLIESGIFKKP